MYFSPETPTKLLPSSSKQTSTKNHKIPSKSKKSSTSSNNFQTTVKQSANSSSSHQFITPIFEIIQDVLKSRNSKQLEHSEFNQIETLLSTKVQNALDLLENSEFITKRVNLFSINCQSSLKSTKNVNSYNDKNTTPRSIVMDDQSVNMINLEFWRLVLVKNDNMDNQKNNNNSKQIIMETKVVARNNLKMMIMRNFLGFSPCEKLLKEDKKSNNDILLFTKYSSSFHEPLTLVPLMEPHYLQKRPIPKFYLSESYSLQLEVFQRHDIDSIKALKSQLAINKRHSSQSQSSERISRYSESSNISIESSQDGLIQDHEHLPSNCPICIESNHLDVNRTHLSSVSTDDELLLPIFTSTPAAKKARKTPSPKNFEEKEQQFQDSGLAITPVPQISQNSSITSNSNFTSNFNSSIITDFSNNSTPPPPPPHSQNQHFFKPISVPVCTKNDSSFETLELTNGIVFNKNTGLPTRSSPIQVPEIQLDFNSENEG